MKFSMIQTEALLRLPDEDKHRILYTGWADDGKPADAALLLGCGIWAFTNLTTQVPQEMPPECPAEPQGNEEDDL